MENKTKKIIIVCATCIIVLIMLLLSFKTVSTGNTGVKLTFGSISKEGLREGIHFKIPFVQNIVSINNQIQKVDVKAVSASMDLQEVTAIIALNYKIKQSHSVSIYSNIGKNYEKILIEPAVQENIKATTSKYTANELISKRLDVSKNITDLLVDKLEKYGVEITSVNIANFDFSKEFSKAIEQKQTAQQLALKAKQDLERIKIEAEQKVVSAKAEAEKKVLNAKAEAESLRLQKQEITDQLINLRAIEKWNGQMPQYVTSSGNGSIFNIPITNK